MSQKSSNIVRDPSCLPPVSKYFIFEPSLASSLLRKAIEFYHNSAEFLGYFGDETFPSVDNSMALIHGPSWVSTRERLLSFGFPDEQIFILPIPEFILLNNSVIPAMVRHDLFYFRAQTLGKLLNDSLTFTRNPNVKINFDKNQFIFIHEKFLANNSRNIEFIRDNLADDLSKSSFRHAISKNPVDNISFFINNKLHIPLNHRFTNNTHIQTGDIIVNFGIFDGLEIPYFLAKSQPGGRMICVDPGGLDFLTEDVRASMRQFPDAVTVDRSAIASKTGEIVLSPAGDGQLSGNRRSIEKYPETVVRVPALTFHDLFKKHEVERVNVLKFDIEGCEEDIIDDLCEIAIEHRPEIHIAIYHAIHHVILLPTKLMHALSDYDFYITAASATYKSMILNCVPRERPRDQYLSKRVPVPAAARDFSFKDLTRF